MKSSEGCCIGGDPLVFVLQMDLSGCSVEGGILKRWRPESGRLVARSCWILGGIGGSVAEQW